MLWVANLPLREDLKADFAGNPGPSDESACADASLYRRFHEAGLTNVKMFPQMAIFDSSVESRPWLEFVIAYRTATFGPEEKKEFQDAVVQAKTDGTFFFAQPHHCAVGTKPI